MGFYRKFVLPHLINLAMSNKDVAGCRSEIIPQARGDVLEVGIGSGLNLPFYSNKAAQVRGVDPSNELLQMARKRAGSTNIPVELLNASAEELPLPDQAVDTIVMTWTLCSIPDPTRALAEMLRVLKPGGNLLFVEHGIAPEIECQSMAEPNQSAMDGCRRRMQLEP
jgi:ubiquinone/menaquinone biosynthesis C-methylase UbiE